MQVSWLRASLAIFAVAHLLGAAHSFAQNFPGDSPGLGAPINPYAATSFFSDIRPNPGGASAPEMRGPQPTAPAVQPAGNWWTGNSSTPGYASTSGYGSAPGYDIGDLCAGCDDNPSHGVVAFASYESFRGVADSSWQNNGISAGLNYGTRLGRFSDWTGIGFQIGASAAAFDWAGTDYRLTHED
jgi:hypothetical protein